MTPRQRTKRTSPPGAKDARLRTLEFAHRRSQHLFEVSKLLTAFDRNQTIPAIFAVLAPSLSIRSAIAVIETAGRTSAVIVWQPGSPSVARASGLAVAQARARGSYGYLRGSSAASSVDFAEVRQPGAAVAAAGTKADHFVSLPLVIRGRPIFGMIQIETRGQLDEHDLILVNSVVNQIAIAVDRQALIDAAQEVTEGKFRAAEHQQAESDSRCHRAVEDAATARQGQRRAEGTRDAACDLQKSAEIARSTAEALRERYEGLVDNLDHAFVWEADAQTHKLSYVSARVETLLGYRRHDWISERRLWLDCVHPDDRSTVAETLRRASAEKLDQRCDHRFVASDGRVLWFRTGIHVARTDGAAQLQGVSMDITQAKSAEEEMRAQLQFTVAVTSSLGEGVLAVDLDGRLTFLNPAAARLVGCSASHALGKLRQDVVEIRSSDGTQISAEDCPFTRVMNRGESVARDDQSFSGPGRAPVPVSYSSAPIWRDGTISGAVVAFQDATERRQLEGSLRDREERFRVLTQNVPHVVWTTLSDGRIDFVNQHWLDYTGQDLPYVQSTSDAWILIIFPADLDETVRRWRQSIATGEPFELEHRIRRGDGLYRWHLSRSHAMRDPLGAISMWIGTSMDIDDQKHAELGQRLLADVSNRLAESLGYRDTLATIVHFAVPVLGDMCMIDEVGSDGVVRRVEVSFADPVKQLALAERAKRFAPQLDWQTPTARVLATGTSILIADTTANLATVAHDEEHARFIRAAGATSSMAVPLKIADRVRGAITFAWAESGRRYDTHDLAVAEEIAHRASLALENARLYEAAQQASRARDAMLHTVSHDLRSPLNALFLYTDLLRLVPGGDPTHRKAVAGIHKTAGQMERMIRDLLDMASIEAGHLSIAPTTIDVDALLREAVAIMQILADQKAVQLTLEPPAPQLSVHCDRDRILQVFANLIGNAIKFTPARGTITVSAERHGSDIRFSLTDTGAGISEDDRTHLFDRFWQAKSTARMGTGLGLSIAKGIVESHGGRLWVDSTLGAGSTFRFTLPSEPAEPARSDHSRQLPGVLPLNLGAAASTRGLILVVDDDPAIRDAMTAVLEKDYDVITAESGLEALAYARRTPPPFLILLDLQMPVMDGWGFLDERSRDPELRAIPVIVISGESGVESRVTAADALQIHKPVGAAELVARVELLSHVH